MVSWRPVIQVLKSDVSGLLQIVSYVKFKVKTGSGGVVRSSICLNLKNGGLGGQSYKFSNRTYQVSFR